MGMKTIEVAAAIITHNDQIFATQRGYGEFKDGWEFPGGKMESGETRSRRWSGRSGKNWIQRSRSASSWRPSNTTTRSST